MSRAQAFWQVHNVFTYAALFRFTHATAFRTRLMKVWRLSLAWGSVMASLARTSLHAISIGLRPQEHFGNSNKVMSCAFMAALYSRSYIHRGQLLEPLPARAGDC